MQVYKKKTEAAKKEYLKALAAYRASLVSKGAGDGEGMYGNYGNYTAGGPPQYGGYTPQGTIPSPPMSGGPATSPVQQPPIGGKKPNMMGALNQQQHPNMMQSPMNHINMQHMQQQQQHNNYMQQVGWFCAEDNKTWLGRLGFEKKNSVIIFCVRWNQTSNVRH